MVYDYAERSLIDARESFEDGNSRSAATLLQQAKWDVEDAPFEFGEIGNEFVERCDEFEEEVEWRQD